MSPRRADANEKIRDQQSTKILDAAEHVFARRGFSATKISDIAAQAGVSHGLVHHYFGSKAGIYEKLVERTMATATALPQAMLDQPGSPLERLTTFIKTVLLGVRYSPHSFFLVIEATASETTPPRLKDLIAEKGNQSIALIARLIEQGQAAGELRSGDPAKLSAHLFALFQGLGLQQAPRGPETEVADAEIIVGMLRR
jgi:AcrR family transcriptional regulator